MLTQALMTQHTASPVTGHAQMNVPVLAKVGLRAKGHGMHVRRTGRQVNDSDGDR